MLKAGSLNIRRYALQTQSAVELELPIPRLGSLHRVWYGLPLGLR